MLVRKVEHDESTDTYLVRDSKGTYLGFVARSSIDGMWWASAYEGHGRHVYTGGHHPSQRLATLAL